jgi:hypothetical protein
MAGRRASSISSLLVDATAARGYQKMPNVHNPEFRQTFSSHSKKNDKTHENMAFISLLFSCKRSKKSIYFPSDICHMPSIWLKNILMSLIFYSFIA